MAKFVKRELPATAAVEAQRAAAKSSLVAGDSAPAQPVQEVARPVAVARAEVSEPYPLYRIGQSYDVPLAKLRSNPVNPRVLYPSAVVESMGLSLRDHGQRQAASGFVDDEGYVVLIEGETRFRGARFARLPTLRVEIQARPENTRSLYERARSINVERREQTPLDDAFCWKALIEQRVYASQAAVATALGLSEDYVSRVMSLSKLPSKVVEFLGGFPELLTLRMLNALREFFESTKDESATLELIAEAARTGLGYREVQKRRQTVSREPIRRPRSLTEAFTYQGGKGTLKAFEDAGRLELSLKGLSSEKLAKLRDSLKELLSKL